MKNKQQLIILLLSWVALFGCMKADDSGGIQILGDGAEQYRFVITSPSSGVTYLTNTSPQIVSGLCSTGVSGLNTTMGVVTDGDCSDGTWAVNTGALVAGNNIVQVTDAKGTVRTLTIDYDTVAPTIQSVSSDEADGAYNDDDTLEIKVTFDKAINVAGGTPTLTLEMTGADRDATYASGSGTTVLIFEYDVQATDTTADLQYVATNSLADAGATLVDDYGNAAVLTLPGLASGNSLGELKDIEIDTTDPVIAMTTPTGATDTRTNLIAVAGTCSTDVTSISVTGIPGTRNDDFDCSDGTFSFDAFLNPGRNDMEVYLSDAAGNNSTTIERRLIACKTTANSADPFADGDGSAADPYVICTVDQLNNIAGDGSATDHFLLANDLGMDEILYNIPTFFYTGTFDGNNHSIFDLSIINSPTDDIGFLQTIASGGVLKNLIFRNITLNGDDRVAIVPNNNGTIDNVHVISGSILGSNYLGALVGVASGNSVIQYSSGRNMTVSASGSTGFVGGLVGNNQGAITESFADVGVSSTDGAESNIGGIVGFNASLGTITDSYATGSVQGEQNVGGIVGTNEGSLDNVYSVGSVISNSGTNGGGIYGLNDNGGSMTNTCNYTDTDDGVDNEGGANGSCTEIASAASLQSANYANFTFPGTWTANDAADHPRLTWETEVNCGGYPATSSPFAMGDGSLARPWRICTATQLNQISDTAAYMNDSFELAQDINASGLASFNPIGSSTNKFSGSFDGNDYTIEQLYVDTFSAATMDDDLALFGYLDGATLQNFNLDDVTFHGGDRTAAVFANAEGATTITDVHVTNAKILGLNLAAGFGSSMTDTTSLSKVSFSGTVRGQRYTAGLVFHLNGSSSIDQCYTEGYLQNDNNVLSAIVGTNNASTSTSISNCYSSMTLASSNGTGGARMGGLIGFASADNLIITNSYYSAGGLTGSDETGMSIAELVGDDTSPSGGTYNNLFYTGPHADAEGSSLTVAQSYSKSSYTGWGDFVSDLTGDDIWVIDDGNGRPRFVWENRYCSGERLTNTPFAGGSGTVANPYTICTQDQMAEVVTADLSDHYKLKIDLEYNGEALNAIVGAFTGTFDGDNHHISNVTYSNIATTGVALFFDVTGAGAEIKNLGMSAVTLLASDEVAGMIHSLSDSAVASGLWVTGHLAANQGVAGLVFEVEDATVEKSFTAGGWVTHTQATYGSGGLVGIAANGAVIDQSYSLMKISNGPLALGAGGLVGIAIDLDGLGTVTITDSYVGLRATVTGNAGDAGGILGLNQNQDVDIDKCYAFNVVDPTSGNHGGIVGRDAGVGGSTTDATNTFNFTDTGNDFGETNLNTAGFQDKSNFTGAGWSGNEWRFPGATGVLAPFLKWE